jgi:hypothetical protein
VKALAAALLGAGAATAPPVTIPLADIAEISTVDIALPADLPDAGAVYPPYALAWPYPVLANSLLVLPRLIPAPAEPVVAISMASPYLVQRVSRASVELFWVQKFDAPGRTASLCKMVLRSERLPEGVMFSLYGTPQLLKSEQCRLRALPGVPLTWLQQQLPKTAPEQLPARVAATARFRTADGVRWQAQIVTAQRDAPPRWAFQRQPWGSRDWRMAAQVSSLAADAAVGVKGAYFEIGLPYDATAGVALRLTNPDVIRVSQDQAYRFAVCHLRANRADAPLPDDAALLRWCGAGVLKAGALVPRREIRVPMPSPPTVAPRPPQP